MTPYEDSELQRIFLDARIQNNSYFEKLAILDGGIVALVITAVLGPLHGIVKHRYSLGAGLTVLVLAMLVILVRNLLATRYEFHFIYATIVEDSQSKSRTEKIWPVLNRLESLGLLLSFVGIVLLLVQVWLILL